MNFKYLCQQFDLGRFKAACPMAPGTVAQVWRLETDISTYLVRTLRDQEQGEREWSIHRHLRKHGFSSMPAILVPCFQQAGRWYQIQEFCSGDRPSLERPGTVGRIAVMVTELMKAAEGCTAAMDVPDRFDLASVWSEFRLNWPLLELPLPQGDADRWVERLSALTSSNRQLIHGDLGLWNMLERKNEIRVIDFGEARQGDPYFDLASALAGLINHSSPENRKQNAAEFLAMCRERMTLDMERLENQVFLWVWRGLAQCVREPEAWKNMAQRFYHALIWCKENLHEL